MSLTENSRSISTLLGNAFEQLGTLLHNEVQLAQAEVSNKVSEAARGAAFLAGAAVLAVPALTLLLAALALWINQGGISLAASVLLAAGIGAIVGVVLGLVGLSKLKPDNLKPKVTIQQVKRDITAAKDIAK
jgi:VIT1/CCC1 family predicted Fe2+/Mn2+ transporter